MKNKYLISVCENYDPSKDKIYNNSRVAEGWHQTTLEWTKEKVQEFTIQNGISPNHYKSGKRDNAHWQEATAIMLDFDDGQMTLDDLIKEQQTLEHDSYLFSSQNHQKDKNGIVCDRLRLLIPLNEPLRTITELSAVKKYFIEKYPHIDRSFMDPSRYFAHGTMTVSVFVDDKGPFKWKEIPDLEGYLVKAEQQNKGKWKRTEKKLIKVSDFVLDENQIKKRIIDIIPDESIYCPYCGMSKERAGDQHNATIMLNEKDLPILFCQSCKSRGNGNEGVYNFDDTDALIYRHNLEDKIVFIDNINPSYYAGCYEKGLNEFIIREMGSKEHTVQFCKYHKIPVPDIYPRARYELVFESDNMFNFEKGFVNRYSATDLIKSQAPAGHIASIPNYIGKLIDHILAHDKDIIDRFYNDIAWWVQKRVKLTTTYLMQGTEGTGKGVFFDNVIRPIIGKQYSVQTDQDAFGKEFNSYLQEHIAMLVNEISGNFSGNKQKELNTVEKMKQAITDLNIQIEDKGVKRVIGKNHCTMFFATNRRHALTLAEDDRRFNVAPRQEVKIANASWWPGYFKMIEFIENELEEFVWYLKQYQVNEGLIGKVIDNEPKRLLQTMSKTNAEMFFEAVKAGNLQWMWDNITEDRSRDSLAMNMKVKAKLNSLSGADKCKTEDLCLLYNNINGKNLTTVTFGRLAAEYIGQAIQLRFGSQNKKGFSISWDEVDEDSNYPF